MWPLQMASAPAAQPTAAPHKPLPSKVTLRIWRGGNDGQFTDYSTPATEGMVVLDAVHRVQAEQANDLAVRWNCKAGKCGSCSMEINGRPRLACMTRMSIFEPGETITVTPLRTFPVIRDLVTDVSFNYAKARQIPSFTPDPEIKPGEFDDFPVSVGQLPEGVESISFPAIQTYSNGDTVDWIDKPTAPAVAPLDAIVGGTPPRATTTMSAGSSVPSLKRTAVT